jgi:hypothetical protein
VLYAVQISSLAALTCQTTSYLPETSFGSSNGSARLRMTLLMQLSTLPFSCYAHITSWTVLNIGHLGQIPLDIALLTIAC